MEYLAHRKNLVKLIQAAARRRHVWEVFGDFVELAALAIANGIPAARQEAREQRYLAVVGRYEPTEAVLFPQMLAELVCGLEAQPGDMLGEVFGELELGNAARGQFFTPYHLCQLMADLTVDEDMLDIVRRRGFITANEPAVGAGAMVIALAKAMQAKGFNFQDCLHVTAVDVDPRAVHMAYVQLSLLGIPAVVILGNTLTLEEREHFYTPAHFLGFWANRLRRGYSLGTPAAQEADSAGPAPVTEAVPARADLVLPIGQLDLFTLATQEHAHG